MRSWNTTHGNLVENEFWLRPLAEIDSEIARLHAEAPLDWFEEVEVENNPFPVGPGYWSVTRHADIAEVSRNAQVYSSADGITVQDIPPEFLEFFSSMIVMDDPRHANLRRLVAKGFTPKMLRSLEESVQVIAKDIVDDVCEKGSVDFVTEVASALPLKIVCDLMGIPDSQYDMVFRNTNVILGISDPEFQEDDVDFITALLTAGGDLQALMGEVAEAKKGGELDILLMAKKQSNKARPRVCKMIPDKYWQTSCRRSGYDGH